MSVQASVYKWWGHVWGMHPRDHVTMMQGVVPVASGLSHMRYELPARIVHEPKYSPKKSTASEPRSEL